MTMSTICHGSVSRLVYVFYYNVVCVGMCAAPTSLKDWDVVLSCNCFHTYVF